MRLVRLAGTPVHARGARVKAAQSGARACVRDGASVRYHPCYHPCATIRALPSVRATIRAPLRATIRSGARSGIDSSSIFMVVTTEAEVPTPNPAIGEGDTS